MIFYNENEFSRNENILKECIINKAKTLNNENYIIYDGVAHPENYYKAKYKIMWILKEPYETNGRYGWQVGKIYKLNQSIKSRTLKPMAYVSYAILNDCDLQNIFKTKNSDLLEAIKSIAYINISKIAAKSRSPQDLSDKYKIWKDVLLKQITIYDPNIIICGNTLQYFLNDIEYDTGIKKSIGMNNHNYYIFNNNIYLNVYHPSYTIGKRLYLTNITNAVNDWKNYIKQKNGA
jgi:hypothetical protein